VDGTQFPNQDIAGLSCSASFPVLNNTGNMFSMATVHPNNPALPRKYVRPIQAWFPHYEEDVAFQACAPQSQPLIDPPLHFSKDSSTGNIGWCAESYPTQNPFVSRLDEQRSDGTTIGRVKNYTSHAVKNSTSSTCTATQLTVASSIAEQDSYELPPVSHYSIPSTSYGVAGTNGCATTATADTPVGVAYHPTGFITESTSLPDEDVTCRNNGKLVDTTCNYCAHQTCDRTVVVPGVSNAWEKFPLLASANQIENALASDTTYGCMISYDNNGGKTGRTTPTGGCCGAAVKMKTSTTAVSSTDYRSAHLEPGSQASACLVPSY
jgi:hypothetical protein